MFVETDLDGVGVILRNAGGGSFGLIIGGVRDGDKLRYAVAIMGPGRIEFDDEEGWPVIYLDDVEGVDLVRFDGAG